MIWAIWLAAAVGSFAVLEAIAIVRGGDTPTLSEKVWQWFKVKQSGPWEWERVLLAVFLGWLFVHLVFAKIGG